MKIIKLFPLGVSTLIISAPILTLASCSQNNKSHLANNSQELITKIFNNYINIINSELTKTPEEYLSKAMDLLDKYSEIYNNNQDNLNPFQIFPKLYFQMI